MLGVAIPRAQPRRLLRGVTQHPAHLLSIQTRGTTGRGGSAKQRRNAMRAPMARSFELLSAKSHGDARANVVTESYSADEVRAANVKVFTSSESGRHHRTAWMGLRWGVRVVGLIGVRQHPVGQCSFDCTARQFQGNHRGDFPTSVSLRKLQCVLTGKKFRTGNHCRQSVQNVLLGFLCNVFGQGAIGGLAHVHAKRIHYRTCSGAVSFFLWRAKGTGAHGGGDSRKCRRGNRQSCPFQQVATRQVEGIDRGHSIRVFRFHALPSPGSRIFDFQVDPASMRYVALTCFAIASPKSPVEAVPPMSGVRALEFAKITAIAFSIESAASPAPRWRNIMAPDQICPMGLAIPFPAISGAEPCTGSNIEGNSFSGFRFAEGAIPMEPTTAGPRSDRMSPKRLEPTTTSNQSG